MFGPSFVLSDANILGTVLQSLTEYNCFGSHNMSRHQLFSECTGEFISSSTFLNKILILDLVEIQTNYLRILHCKNVAVLC